MMYLDTNVILYAIERHPKYGNACKRIMYAIERGHLKVGASVFVLLEVMGGLQKFNRLPRLVRRPAPLFSIKENLDAILSISQLRNFMIFERYFLPIRILIAFLPCVALIL